MFIKICGITRLEDAEAAVQLGADALGFVFWPRSPRLVDPARVGEMTGALSRPVLTVGVFVNQPADEVNRVADRARLGAVQLHGDETPQYAAAIERPIIKAIRVDEGAPRLEWPEGVMWLVDALDRDRRGGTGKRANWSAAAVVAKERRVLLAGGLNAANIADAIAEVRPFGVDVSSGVELVPGLKDKQRLIAFFQALHEVNHHTARS